MPTDDEESWGQRPTTGRFIVLARHSEDVFAQLVARIRVGERIAAQLDERLRGPRMQQASEIPGVCIIAMSRFDDSMLVEAPRFSVRELQARLTQSEVFEEHRCWLQRVRPPKVRRQSRVGARSVVVLLDDGMRTPLSGVLVTAIVSTTTADGDEGTTDSAGRVTLRLGAAASNVEELYIEPLHGAWPLKLYNVVLTDSAFEVLVRPLDVHVADTRNVIYGMAPATAGQGVRVAVVDTGVGPHSALPFGGMNLLLGEPPHQTHDLDGHGTHVAGVIAAQVNGNRAGEAPAADLRSYRVLTSSRDPADHWNLREGVLNAAADGCHLINMSLAGSIDGWLCGGIAAAWHAGSVCVVAAGNDAHQQVAPTARDPRVLAVTAIGLIGCWPGGCMQATRVSTELGSSLGGFVAFFANFSNRGSSVALTAPGVGIVSTIHQDRWGVMDGTSMATPVATGVLARRLADSPQILRMDRDQRRSNAIRALAITHGEDILLHRNAQGAGLAR